MSIDPEQSPSANPSSHYAAPTASDRDETTHDHAPPPGSGLTHLELFLTRIPKPYITAFCGASGGVMSGIVTCPLDVIKTKLQAQRGKSAGVYRGMIGTARVIWREDGIRGMYRGLGPMLLGYLPTWAVYLTVYDSAREYFYTKTGKPLIACLLRSEVLMFDAENKFVARACASVTAGGCSTLVTNPIWVIKTRLMAQVSSRAANNGHSPPWHYKSTVDAARKIYRTEGLRAFYSGLTPALLGLTHVAVQFPMYEYFKMHFTGLEMGEQSETDSQNSNWAGIVAATFLSKLCASSATYPHEVLRTRLQTQQRSPPLHSSEDIAFRGGLQGPQDYGRPPGGSSSDGMMNRPHYRGVIKTCKTILREEGWRAFYNGMGTNMIRAVPAAITTMMTYEYLQSALHSLQGEGNRKLEIHKENLS
ncbi:MAG: hypothetical protein M1819_007037 [Sarea resinae]|nr:MAG: hypothetical protein M1819_007037 [Sarea resinae]